VAIRQRYPGHARQARLIASQCHTGAYMGRYMIVVDHDIDITDINAVLWTMCTHVDLAQSVEIIRRACSGPTDPGIHKDKKGFSSRMIIDACPPYEWLKDFSPIIEIRPEQREAPLRKRKKLFD